MNINQIRTFAQSMIDAAHDAGWHCEAFRLGDRLYSINYQPTPEAAVKVKEYAQWLAACLEC